MKVEYGEGMDSEVVALCDALNRIPGFETVESCCGHGDRTFCVWFLCHDVRYMYVLGRALDRRYGGYGFECRVDTGDLPDRGNTFRLESVTIEKWDDEKQEEVSLPGSDRGEQAYKAAEDLAGRIDDFLNDRRIMRYYNLLQPGDIRKTSHHIWCNYWTRDVGECSMCARLWERYPYDIEAEIPLMMHRHFPEVIRVGPAGG